MAEGGQDGPSLRVPSAHPALDALDEQVERRYRDEEAKREALRTQTQLLRAQAQFSQEGQPRDHSAAYAVQHFASRARVRHEPGTGSVRNVFGRGDDNVRPASSAFNRPQASSSAASSIGSLQIHQKCDVLYCEIEFSSLGNFIKHTENHNHSPCNPTRHLIDGKLRNEAPNYCCTTCGNLYKTEETCLTHMEETGHDHLQEPVVVPGFICLQCFMVFPNAADCRMHQHKEDHWQHSCPLEDDSGRIEPQFLPGPVHKEFRKACKAVPSRVECMQCSVNLPDSVSAQVHVHDSHLVMATTDSTLAEAWSSMVFPYTCVQCQRLYKELPPDGLGALHECSPTMVGMIVESDVKNTYDFILRRSLSHISLVPEDKDNAAGTTDTVSRLQRSANDNTGAGSDIEEIEDDQTIELLDDSISELNIAPDKRDRCKSVEIIDVENPSISTLNIPLQASRSLSVEVIENPSGNRDKEHSRPGQAQQPNAITVNVSDAFGKRKRDVNVAIDTNSSTIKKRKGSPNGATADSPPDIEDRSRASMRRSPTFGSCAAASGNDLQEVSIPSRSRANAPATKVRSTSPGPTAGPSRGPRPQEPSHVPPPRGPYREPTPRHNPSHGRPKRGPYQGPPSQGPSYAPPLQGPSHAPPLQGPSHAPPPQNQQNRPRGTPILNNLHEMKHIIFVDFDNWMGFFQRLLAPLPDRVFVWGFYGGSGVWKPPIHAAAYKKAIATKCFYLNDKCGRRKDAADFAICMYVGRKDGTLPPHIPFTILSGDKGFEEIESQMRESESGRRVRVINPHHQKEDELYILLLSMMDT